MGGMRKEEKESDGRNEEGGGESDGRNEEGGGRK